MRLSPFHVQLAKEFAQGKRNADIIKAYPVKDARLSVIKANPLFKQEIERQRKKIEDKYEKALNVLEDEAENVAKELVTIVKNPSVTADVRSKTAENILNRIAQKSGHGSSQLGNELVFEQMLRVTKRTSDNGLADSDLGPNAEDEYKDLLQDLTPVDEEFTH